MTAQCETHAGEPYQPHCRLCESLSIEYEQLHLTGTADGLEVA